MKNLHISNCNLRYICPYLHTAVQEAGRFLVIDASKNPDLKLSFIPSKIYEFPTADFKAIVGELPRLGSYRPCIPNYANFSTTTFLDKDEELRDTSRIYKIGETTQENYKFNSIGIKQDESFCNCCAACGEFTNELLFCQQIPMDSVLLVKEESENQTEYFNEKLLKAAVFFEPGHWKAKVKSRLCINCMQIFNTKINAFYEEFQNGIKRTKCANTENNEKTDKSAPEPITPPIGRPRKTILQNQLPQILPETSDDLQSQLPCNTETSTSRTLLPPINTIRASYYNTNNSDLQNLPDQATTNFIQRLEYARIADNEYPDRFENSYYYNPTTSLPPPEIPVTYTLIVKQKTVLLDPSGNPIAIWEPLPDSSNGYPSFTSL
uniref:Uncharacterized protein n=1 Tax=Panagrolaimus sp. ES5 TaxID=591445 RepID=A0AC34FI49_9BILA